MNGYHKMVISMNVDRQELLNYDINQVVEGVPFEMCPDWIIEKMKRRYNENLDGKKFKGKCGCLAAHLKTLELICLMKLNNVIVLEDDAFLDVGLEGCDIPECLEQPCLLGAAQNIIDSFKPGINRIDYKKFRWIGTYAILYPTWESAAKILKHVKECKTLNSWDLYLANNKLINYLHYPSVFTHDDTKEPGFHTTCVVKDYVNRGRVNRDYKLYKSS
jgi:hypothetical protein